MNQNYAELAEVSTKLAAEPFEVLAFPCNQFMAQEPGTPESIHTFVSSKLEACGVAYSIFEMTMVNGKDASPVYHFLRYNSSQTRRGSRLLPIPWNFSKFLLDQDGRVVKYYGPTTPPSQIEPDIRAVLDGVLQGEPTLPPTIEVHKAPKGFAPQRHPSLDVD